MYLADIFIENFRIFGSQQENKHLSLQLHPGLNVIVGENDSGKSALIDAIRYVLWTTSQDYHRLTDDDFHVHDNRASNLTIQLVFRELSIHETARYCEWLTIENGAPCLYVTMKATRLTAANFPSRTGRNIATSVRSGKNADGKPIEGEIREFLRTTYLRPLRDAEAELSPGRGSRLSQILQSHPEFRTQNDNDFDPDCQDSPKTLIGIMRQAEHLIEKNEVVSGTQTKLNSRYLQDFSIGSDALEGEIGVARHAELHHILEKLDLTLRPPAGQIEKTRRGLGVNNVLFMATELLLLSEDSQYGHPLLLIEEPEAHLHPQLQLRLMDFLESKSKAESGKLPAAHKEDASSTDHQVQIIFSTHSPNLASKVNVEQIILMHEGKAYPLAPLYTELDPSDYRYLQRFLDVTKANLFFAKGVVIVEGDAENILLPTIAELIGKSFSKNGVSIVNVGSTVLFRYARILQRKDGAPMPVKVACLADRDIPPDTAADYVKNRSARKVESEFNDEQIQEMISKHTERDGGSVKTFVSNWWTFEYDLACAGLGREMHIAVQLARKAYSVRPRVLTSGERESIIQSADEQYNGWTQESKSLASIAALIYKPLFQGQASKTETAQYLAEYLQDNRDKLHPLEEKLPSYLRTAIDYVTNQE